MTHHLFVYGTLRKDANHDMHRILARNARFTGNGRVMGRLYDLGNYPGMVISSVPGEWVDGEVYELTARAADEVLRTLDDYEGNEYRRELVDVHLSDATTLTAWAYVLADAEPKSPRIPASDYLDWNKARASLTKDRRHG